VRVIHDAIPEFQMVSPAAHPRLYARLLQDIAAGRLPERRLRSNPRVVKRKMSNFRPKRPELSPPPRPPKEIVVFHGTGGAQLPISQHDVDGQEVVTSKATLADEPAHATTKREASNARRGYDATGGCKVKRLGLAVEFTQVTPPSAGTVRRAGSTRIPFISDKSMTRPRSQMALPRRCGRPHGRRRASYCGAQT
jgi:hypothetical protein